MRANVEYKMWQKRMYGRLPYYVRKHFSQRQTFVFTVIVGTFGLLALIIQLIIFVHSHKLTFQDKGSQRYGIFNYKSLNFNLSFKVDKGVAMDVSFESFLVCLCFLFTYKVIQMLYV